MEPEVLKCISFPGLGLQKYIISVWHYSLASFHFTQVQAFLLSKFKVFNDLIIDININIK